MTRKMATIRQIKDIQPIVGADAIEVAQVDGWKVVVKKGEYQVGDMCIYCEIDSWIPHSIAPFLTKEGSTPKVFNNVEGQRLKTVKLRGQISQGLILPINTLDNVEGGFCWYLGNDVSDALGITKWELPVRNIRSGAGQPAGIPFPDFIPKTDQERVQNIPNIIQLLQEHTWEVTEKLHGQSMTVYYKDGKVGVCSRNIELREWIKHKVRKQYKNVVHKYWDKLLSVFVDTTKYTYTREPLWEAADRAGVIVALKSYGANIAIQGELVGKGIQSQTYGIDIPKFFVFDIYDIDKQEYFNSDNRFHYCQVNDVAHVPIAAYSELSIPDITNVDMLLTSADGMSMLYNSLREGLVFKSLNDPSVSFKVVSNEWLLKEK